jgi:hypothetical protein
MRTWDFGQEFTLWVFLWPRPTRLAADDSKFLSERIFDARVHTPLPHMGWRCAKWLITRAGKNVVRVYGDSRTKDANKMYSASRLAVIAVGAEAVTRMR